MTDGRGADREITVTIQPSEPAIGEAQEQLVTVALPQLRETLLLSEGFEKTLSRPLVRLQTVIQNLVENLGSLFGSELPNAEQGIGDHNIYQAIGNGESKGFSSGAGYRGTHSVDPTDECGRFFIDTIVDDRTLSIIARSTIDAEKSVGVVGFSALLENGQELPVWITELGDGEYLLTRTAGIETVGLRVIAHRENADDLIRYVDICLLYTSPSPRD